MAAEVEVQTGEVGRTVAGARLHLSPLTDSSNKSLIDISSISQAHIIATEPNKPSPTPKPRLTPKPFSVEKNPTIKPILAPKPHTKPRPESTRLAGCKPDLPNTPKPAPRLGSTNHNRPAPTAFKTSNKFNAAQTVKPVVQPFKAAPPDLGDVSKPTPSLPAEIQKPTGSSLAYSKTLKGVSAAEWCGTTTSKAETLQKPQNKAGASITRAKSMGFLAELGKEEEEKGTAQPEVSVPLRPQPRSSRPRPVSAIFPCSPTKEEAPVPAPRLVERRPLSADLTSKFESIGLSLHRKSPSASRKESTPEERELPQENEQDRNQSVTPQRTEAVADPPVTDQSNKKTEESAAKETEEDKRGASIKMRISLLLDSSSSPGATGQVSDLPSPQPVPEAEPPVGVRQLIKQLTEDATPPPVPVAKPVLKPRPLPLDLTKRFSSERSPDLISLTEAADRHELGKDPQRGVEASAVTPKDQNVFLDLKDPPEQIHKVSVSEEGQMGVPTKDGVSSGGAHTVRASLFENVVERHSVLMMDDGKSVNPVKDPTKTGDVKNERALVPAAYREPVSPSSPLCVLHAFDTVQAVEENRAVSESVPSALWEDKATTLRSKRSDGNRMAPEWTEPGQVQPALATLPQPQLRYLRVGALQKWTDAGLDQNAGLQTGLEPEPAQMALDSDTDGQRTVDEDEAAAAPKRLKMLPTEEQPKPRATFFALTGQMQEPSSPGHSGTSFEDIAAPSDDFCARSVLRGSQGKIVPVRRNQSLEEAFGKSPYSPGHPEALMSPVSPTEIRPQMNEQTKEERIDAEKERVQVLESERHRIKMRNLEREKQKRLEMEKLAQLEFAQMKEMEMQREFERQRQRAFEKEKQELEEKQRALERQKQMELEKQKLQELEKRKEIEKERQLQVEKDKRRELERQREMERERQRLREEERQRELDKEQRLLEMQKEKQKMEEMERIKERERQLLDFQRQKQRERERQQQLAELERQNQQERKEREAVEKLRQMALEQEMLRIKEIEREMAKQKETERERQKELEREKQKELEREKQKEMERRRQKEMEREKQKQLEMRQELENQKLRQRDMEKEKQRKEDLERIQDLERRQLMEFEKHKLAEREKHISELEKRKLKEKMEREEAERREEAEKMRLVAKQQEAERQRLKEKQKKEEQERLRLESSALRPKVLDLDSVLRDDPLSSPAPQRSDPATRWREPYKPVILDIDSFTSQTQVPSSKDLFTDAPFIQGLEAEVAARPQLTPERDWKAPAQASVGISSPVWISSAQDPWELRPVEMSVDQPVAEPRNPVHKMHPEQALLGQEERLPHPQRHWAAFLDEPLLLAPFPGTEVLNSNPSGELSGGTPGEQIWIPREPRPPQEPRANVRNPRRSHGSQELNRMRSRSMSRRSTPSSSTVDESLFRVRSRSAHREQDRHSWVQQKQGGEEQDRDSETPAQETDSQYGTWETGLRTDDSLTPATPSSESNLSPSPRKPTPPHTPDEQASQLDTDTLDGLPPARSSDSQPLPFPDASTTLLDTSVLRSRAQLGKKRAPRTRPTRAARQSAPPAEGEGRTSEDWLFRDSTEPKAESKDEDSESEEQTRGADASPAVSSQPQRIALFPGVDPSALKAQLKKRGDSDNQTDGPTPSPSLLSRSPKSPFLPRAARVLPPPGGKENSGESSPQWLKELKSKKRVSQYENES